MITILVVQLILCVVWYFIGKTRGRMEVREKMNDSLDKETREFNLQPISFTLEAGNWGKTIRSKVHSVGQTSYKIEKGVVKTKTKKVK